MTSASTPPTSVPASCAMTIATRTVALTRPSWRSPTRAWRTDTSVTSNTVTAVSPISCWPIRHAIATSGSPGGASGIRRLPSAANSSDTSTTRPSPKRTTARSASSAPSSDPKPPSAATTPMTAGSRCRSSVTNSSHVAPNTPHIAASPIVPHARPRSTGSRTTSRRPSRISSSDRLALGGGRGRRLGAPDRAEQHGRDHERERIDGDRDRRRQQVDQEPGDAEGGELDRRAGRGEGAVGAHEVLAADDGREVRAIGDVEERRQHRGQRRHHEHLGQRQPAADRPRPGCCPAARPGRGRPRSGRAVAGAGRPTRRPRTRPAAPRRGRGCAAPRPRSVRRGA